MILKKAQESGNLEEMKAKLEALNEKAQALAVKLYEQAAAAQQAQAGAEGAQAAGNAGDDVVDGEFTENKMQSPLKPHSENRKSDAETLVSRKIYLFSQRFSPVFSFFNKLNIPF